MRTHYNRVIRETNELQHFGVLGMRWGKHKSQNKPFKERTYADMFMPTKKMADKANAKSAERRSKKTEKKLSNIKKMKDQKAKGKESVEKLLKKNGTVEEWKLSSKEEQDLFNDLKNSGGFDDYLND